MSIIYIYFHRKMHRISYLQKSLILYVKCSTFIRYSTSEFLGFAKESFQRHIPRYELLSCIIFLHYALCFPTCNVKMFMSNGSQDGELTKHSISESWKRRKTASTEILSMFTQCIFPLLKSSVANLKLWVLCTVECLTAQTPIVLNK